MKGMQFHFPMVRALIDGKKTETRRVIQPQPDEKSARYVDGRWEFPMGGQCGHGIPEYPYGCVGDEIYVKENFWISDKSERIIYEDGVVKDMQSNTFSRGVVPVFDNDWEKVNAKFMPFGFRRLSFKIAFLRCERIQEITLEGVKKEGTEYNVSLLDHMGWMDEFKALWDGINKKRGFGWDKNPFVFVIGIKDVENKFENKN